MEQLNLRLRPFLLAYMAMLSGCFYLAFSSVSADKAGTLESSAGESFLYQLLWVALYVALIIRLLIDIKDYGRFIGKLAAPLLLVAASLVSNALNDGHIESVVKLSMFMATILFAAWAASAMPAEEFFENLYRLAFGVAVLQLVAYPFLKQWSAYYDPMERQTLLGVTAYAGLFAHKTHAGIFFALGLLIGMNKITWAKPKISELFFLFAQLLCLILAGAATPLLSLVFVYIITAQFSAVRMDTLLHVAVFLAVLLVCGFAMIFMNDILSLFGRDAGFTGRSELFANWSAFFLRKPIFGYGYAEFFSDRPDSPVHELNALTWGQFATWESGYLQSAIDFGGIGLAIYIYIIISSLASGFKFLESSKSKQRKTPLEIVIFVIVVSFTNNHLDLHNSLFLAIVFYIYFRPKSAFQRKPATLY